MVPEVTAVSGIFIEVALDEIEYKYFYIVAENASLLTTFKDGNIRYESLNENLNKLENETF